MSVVQRRSAGTLRQQRKRLPWPAARPFRILSIDGGGIKGILPASVLAEVESRLLGGKTAGGYFDLICGTSTGGIIALGLANGLSSSEIAKVYRDHGEAIFPPLQGSFQKVRRVLRFLRSIRHYRYERDVLQRQLVRIFGRRTLGEAERRLCIPAFDGQTEVFVFKTPHHPDFRLDWREELVTVALATSAAPTFFPVYRNGERKFGDGGVWANNPVMIGLVDALTCYEIHARQVHILSLGCGDSDIKISEKQVRLGGLWHWREIISAAMHLSSQNALGQAGLLIGRDQLLRLDAPPFAKPIEMDDYRRSMDELTPLAGALVDQFEQQLLHNFFSDAAPTYEAFHGPRA